MRITVKSAIITVLMVILPLTLNAALPGFMLKKMGTMKGQAIVDGEPLTNSLVAFFLEKKGLPPVSQNMRRVPEFLARTDVDGNFTVKLMAGKYYIGMLKREAGAAPGPPREGEEFYFAGDEQSGLEKYSIADQEEKDVGRVSGVPPDSFNVIGELFTVQGVVLNGVTRQPYGGSVIMAKTALNIPRPEYISPLVGPDGKFTMGLAAGRSYYLVARQTIAGSRPRPGDYIGTYGVLSAQGNVGLMFGGGAPPPGVKDDDKSDAGRALTVNGAKGEFLRGLEILVFPVPDPQAIKSSLQGTAGSPGLETGARMNNILFAFNSDVIEKSSTAELDKWIKFLKGRPDIRVELSGHTDSSGDDQFNMKLSRDRAKAIATYFINNNIDVLRIMAKGYGETMPVADNRTEAGRRKNRRVEIKFLKR